jgi:integrase
MAVYKRGAKNVFYMNFTVNGVRVFKSTGKFTKKEAIIVEALEKKRLMDDSSLSPKERASKMLLADAVEQVYAEKWRNNKDPNGIYARGLRLISCIGNIPLGHINEDVVYKLIKTLESQGLTLSTCNRYMATLKTILRHKRQSWEHIKLRKERKGRTRIISHEEEKLITDLLRVEGKNGRRNYFPEMGELVVVLIDTGMRLGEALALRYDDINYATNLISIWFNKADRPRSIPMTIRVKDIIQSKQTALNNIKVFNIKKDRAEWAWRCVREQLGLRDDKEFVIHALRHTCASRLVNAGIDIYTIKEWLGHSSIQVTERYSHLSPDRLAHAAKMLDIIDRVG